ncbi:MAG: hypothetical protein ACOVNO_07515 [Sediminibacterium sp.]
MRKRIAILFLSIYLCSTTEAHELLKIPVVFQHFIEHQQEDPQISVIQFLHIHYLQGDVKDKDYDRDMQLPFKTAGEFFASSATPFVPLNAQIVIQYPEDANNIVWSQQTTPFLFSAYQVNIWQPPKRA